jgi:hypothetical protein
MIADIANGNMTPAVIIIAVIFPKGPDTIGIKEVSVRKTKRPVIILPSICRIIVSSNLLTLLSS